MGDDGPMSAPEWRAVAAGVVARVKTDDVPSLAAGIAFKVFLSLFPALLAALAVFSYVIDPIEVARDLRPVLPPGFVNDIIEERLVGIARDRSAAAVALIAGALGGLWAASSAAVTLVRALNRINGVTDQRGFVAQRGIALLLILGLLGALTVVVGVIVLGPQLRRWLLSPQLGMAGSVLFTVAQILVAVAALMLLFAFIYWLAPNRELPRWQWRSPGSVVGVLGWLVLSLAFSAFVQSLGTYEETYGSLAAVALTMLWLQLSMTVLLLGAEIDVEFEHRHDTAEALAEGVGMDGFPPAAAAAGGAVRPTVDPTRRPRVPAALAGLAALVVAVVVAARGRR